MADIRQRVEDERGLLKKIQLFVPGFRGYRQREDLRDADRMLRQQLAANLAIQRRKAEEARSLIAVSFNSKELEMLGSVISQYKRLEGETLHASVGYSGISADVNIKQDKIYDLYDHDLAMFEAMDQAEPALAALRAHLAADDKAAARTDILEIRDRLSTMEDRLKRRIIAIEGTEARA